MRRPGADEEKVLIILNEENRRLFGEQVNDHVAKLNVMMGHPAGEMFDEKTLRKTCFANRLLAGSTRMLGLQEWSGTLTLFGKLLDAAAASSGRWDENLSQIVSEVLEAEEQVVAEIMDGEIEEKRLEKNFAGLQQEVELLMSESSFDGDGMNPFIEEIPAVRVEKSEGEGNALPSLEDDLREDDRDAPAPDEDLPEAEEARSNAEPSAGDGGIALQAAEERTYDIDGAASSAILDTLSESTEAAPQRRGTNGPGAPEGRDGKKAPPEMFSTLARLVGSLDRLNERIGCYLYDPGSRVMTIKDLELAFGESEFFIGLVGNMLDTMGENGKVFRSKVSSRTVLDGVEDFTEMNAKIRGWKVALSTQAQDFSMERITASELAVILESCVFDICRKYEGDKECDLSVGIGIVNEGSYLIASIKDSGKDFLCDSKVNGEDAVAYYKSLLKIRGVLKKWGCLLWVEPGRGTEGRFRFTFPRSSIITDYYLVSVSGKSAAVPCRCVEGFIEAGEIVKNEEEGSRRISVCGASVPVCALDELSPDEIDPGGSAERVMVMGLAEKRLGILIDGQPRKVEGIFEQVTEGGWASLSAKSLQISDQEYPILDAGLVLDRFGWIQELDGSMEEPGSYMEEEKKAEESVSRV